MQVQERTARMCSTKNPQAIAEDTFRFLSLAEALASPALPTWLVRGYLEQDTLAMLFGEPGSMKSFLAIDLGLCIASGLPWHGAKVGQGPVCYIAGEGFRGIMKRIQAWCCHKDLAPSEIPFTLAREAVQFLDEVSAQAVTAAVMKVAATHGTPVLIIIDTLSRCMGGDENGTADMSAFVAVMTQLRARFNCAILLVHHPGLGDKTRPRGNTALHGACDWEYSLNKVGKTLKFFCTKVKDFDAPPDVYFEPEQVDTGWVDPETGQEITSCVLRMVAASTMPKKQTKLTPAHRATLDSLIKVCADSSKANIRQWRQEAYKTGVSSSAKVQAKKKAFNRAVDSLREKGLIQTADNLYWPTTGGTRGTDEIHVPECPPSPTGVQLVHPPIGGCTDVPTDHNSFQ